MTIAEVWKKSSLYVAVSLCLGLFAQAGVLKVTCEDQSGAAISGVQVHTVALAKQKVEDEKANGQGVATFKDLPDGYYRVFAHEEGYAPTYVEFVELKGNEQKSVTLTFKPGEADQMLYFEDDNKLATAQQALQAGGTALQNQQFDEAEAQLKTAIENNPAEPASYFSLGMLYVQQKKWDQAEPQLKKAEELFKIYQDVQGESNPVIGQQLDKVQNELKFLPIRRLADQIDAASKAKDWDKALGYIDQLQKLQPNDPRIYYTKAYMLAQNRKIDEAITAIDKAIELKPDEQDFEDLKNQLTAIRKQQQARQEANAEKNKVAEVQQLNKDGKYQEAIDRAQQVLPEVSKDLQPILWAEITNAHIRLHQYAEAVDAYQKDLELNEKPVAPGLYALGDQFVHKGQQEAASVVFKKVLELDPNFAEAYYQLGMYYFYEKQDKAQAKQMLEKYLKIGKDEDNINNAKNVLTVMEKG